jgi:hypothetical protein
VQHKLHYCNSELSGVAPVPDVGLVGGVDPGRAARDEGQDNGSEVPEKMLPRPTSQRSQREAKKTRRHPKDVAAEVVVFQDETKLETNPGVDFCWMRRGKQKRLRQPQEPIAKCGSLELYDDLRVSSTGS